jgi:beta-lactamase class A
VILALSSPKVKGIQPQFPEAAARYADAISVRATRHRHIAIADRPVLEGVASATAGLLALCWSLMLTRRLVLPLLLCLPAAAQAGPGRFADLPGRFRELEVASGGRLGVAVLDTGTGEQSGHRRDERFPMCSTFKVLLSAAVLARVDSHQESLDRALTIPAGPLLSNSPLTQAHAGGTMSIAELCEAIVTVSDNTAANLLLDTVGGPAGVTRFARALRDDVTRLDRMELALNECQPGDPRDTTSPSAMVNDLRSLLLGKVLAEPSGDRLRQWMEASRTGLECLRAQLPEGWRAADKTGRNGEHTSNDVAVLWPPGRPPLVIAAYITQCPGAESKRASLLAEIGRLAAQLSG